MKIVQIFPLFVGLFGCNVQANTWFVAPNGSDDNVGTIGEPFATIQKAADLAFAGDTIYLRGGTYLVDKGIKLDVKSGNNTHRIKLFNYPNETPVLDASAMNQKETWVVTIGFVGSWWHIKGLEIKNNRYGGGIAVNTSNNIIEGNDTHHNGKLSEWAATGISVFFGDNNLILNNDSHHNQDADGGDADGIGINSNGLGNVVRGNRVWRNSDDGIDLWNAAPTHIEGNWSWENGYDQDFKPLGNGMGFKLGGQHLGKTSGGHTVKNNMSWKNLMDGFSENGAQIAMKLYNNTAWNNNRFQFNFGNAIPNVFKNNLSFGGKGNSLGVGGESTNNSWTLSVVVGNDDFQTIDDTDARFTRKPSNCGIKMNESKFLKLKSGSDLIDKGINVDTPYLGKNPDLGAFEKE